MIDLLVLAAAIAMMVMLAVAIAMIVVAVAIAVAIAVVVLATAIALGHLVKLIYNSLDDVLVVHGIEDGFFFLVYDAADEGIVVEDLFVHDLSQHDVLVVVAVQLYAAEEFELMLVAFIVGKGNYVHSVVYEFFVIDSFINHNKIRS